MVQSSRPVEQEVLVLCILRHSVDVCMDVTARTVYVEKAAASLVTDLPKR